MRLHFKPLLETLVAEADNGRIYSILKDVNEKRLAEDLKPLTRFIDATDHDADKAPVVILVDLGVSYSQLTGISKGNVGTMVINFCRPNQTRGLEHENEFATSFYTDITEISSIANLLTGWGPSDSEVNKTIAKDLHRLIKEAEDGIR